jgi:hypothetical protein
MSLTTSRNHNALYRWLKEKGQIKKLDGGYEIVRPLDYAENSTFQRYSGFDALNISASDVLTAAKYDWMQSAVHVVASGRELRMNSGSNQIIDLAKARLKNAIRTAANNSSVDIYSSGSLTNQMGGLGALVTTDGTGTVGGIVSGTYTWWKNQFLEISGSNAWTKSTIKGFMNTLWLQCVRGTDKPDLIVSTNDFYSAYWEGLQDLQRFTSVGKSAGYGFDSLKYLDCDVVHDSQHELHQRPARRCTSSTPTTWRWMSIVRPTGRSSTRRCPSIRTASSSRSCSWAT